MTFTFEAVNELSKVLYSSLDTTNDKFTFDFAASASEVSPKTLRITWTLGEAIITEAINAINMTEVFIFTLSQNLNNRQSTMHDFLDDREKFLFILLSENYKIQRVGGLSVNTDGIVECVIEATKG